MIKRKQIIRAMDEKNLDIDKIVELLYNYKGRIYTRLDVNDAVANGATGDIARKMHEILGFGCCNPPLPRRSAIERLEYKKLLHRLERVNCQSGEDDYLSAEFKRIEPYQEPYKRLPSIKPYKGKFIAKIRRGRHMRLVGVYSTYEEAEKERERFAIKHGLDDR